VVVSSDAVVMQYRFHHDHTQTPVSLTNVHNLHIHILSPVAYIAQHTRASCHQSPGIAQHTHTHTRTTKI
jgi:hypothetical protein